MNEQNKTCVDRAYESLNNQDIEAIVSLMHPNVCWPDDWEGGVIEGQEQVRHYWTRQWREMDPKVKPLSLKENSIGQVEAIVHQVARDLKGNVLSDGILKHVYTFEDGLIRGMEIQKP